MFQEQEWWYFWGVIFAACPCGKGGGRLFESEKAPRRFAPVVDLSIDKSKFDERTGQQGKKLLSFDRFTKIKERIRFAFYHEDAADPWHPIKGLVADYNDNRKKLVACSIVLVLDESMSNFQPRTTKSSLLPFLSFIFRKPKPLGVEYKSAACTKTKMGLFLEIQRGKKPMRKLRFFTDVGITAACTLHLGLGAAYSGQATKQRRDSYRQEQRHLILADSWFGSVKVAEAFKLLRRRPTGVDGVIEYSIDREAGENPNGFEIIAAVKTNHAFFPKKALEKKMKPWPSGSYLVMQTTCPESKVELIALGYKYNARKVLCFIMTKNAGSTAPGEPYIAKFPDTRFGNVCHRKVTR